MARALEAPIVHALRGKEHVEYDNPYDVGMTGLLGFASGYDAMMDCDLLLMLGTDFPYPQFYPPKATSCRWTSVRENLGAAGRWTWAWWATCRTTLAALLPPSEGESPTDGTWTTRSRTTARRARALDDLATGEPGSKPIHPQYLTRVVDALAADDAIFTCDVGRPTLWAARYLTMNGRRRSSARSATAAWRTRCRRRWGRSRPSRTGR